MDDDSNDSLDTSHSHGSFLSLEVLGAKRSSVVYFLVVTLAAAAVLTCVGLVALWPNKERPQEIQENAIEIGLTAELLRATVHEASEADCGYSFSSEVELCRNVTVMIQEGPDSGSLVALAEVNTSFDPTFPKLSVGDDVILGFDPGTGSYYYQDRDRLSSLWWLIGLFALLVVCLARARGLLALLAMGVTVGVLVKFVAPSVLDGNDPVLVCVVAAAAIAFFSLYFTHGFNLMTTVALAGTLIALSLTLGISWVFFELAKFSGFSSEEAFILPFLADTLDVRGLLL
ncbi:MAG: YibE/F family protein, partial [Acidimicrobiales bacterium]|nr:YibE/F family protein [Acidimicrobiales bacterium]